ncbi:hypothetical protein [Yersinia massiliensis]|uniref:hypothetical protein n=1 Tax=Yersinia massiliensis TaxID=419257 RepID=UPI0002E582EE|nr:hypothetical protein [Yersinia massiliensis]
MNSDEKKLLQRKNAAKVAINTLRPLKVRSTNNPFVHVSNKKALAFEFGRYNGPQDLYTVEQRTRDTRIGNCDEKGKVCLVALMKLQEEGGLSRSDHKINFCKSFYYDGIMKKFYGYDHVYIIISDPVGFIPTSLKEFGKTAVVVDGWTEDWYFPNIGITSRENISLNLSNIPNPRQKVVRDKIAKHIITPYHNPAQRYADKGGEYNHYIFNLHCDYELDYYDYYRNNSHSTKYERLMKVAPGKKVNGRWDP